MRNAITVLILLWAGMAAAQELGESPGKPADEPAVAEEAQPIVIPPRLKQFVNAEYPQAALEGRLEAVVNMLVVVDETGKVTEVQVQQPVGNGFDEAAVAAVEKFEFEPATVDGQPAAVRIGYGYHFKLEEKAVKTEPGQVIEGVLKEAGVKLPVLGAEVALAGRARVTTDKKGRFRLKNIEPGEYQLIITHPEFKRVETAIVVEADKTLKLELLAEPLIDNPYETVVVGKKQETVVSKYVLEQRTLETVPGTFGDPVRVVETLPGVARPVMGMGMLVIRGATAGESMVYVDGVEVPIIYHFLGGPSVLNPNFLDTIDYYPGNFPTKYGGATAGIVDVIPKHTKVEAWSGELDLNLINLTAYLEGKIGDKFYFRAGVRRSWIDWVLGLVMNWMDYDAMTIAPFFWDVQAEVGYELNDRNRLSLFYLGSYDSLELVFGDEDDAGIDLDSHTNWHRVIGAWRHVGKGYSVVLKPFFGYDGFGFDTGAINFDVDLWNVGGRLDVNIRPNDWLSILAGIEGKAQNFQATGEVPLPEDYFHPGSTLVGGIFDETGDIGQLTRNLWYWNVAPYLDLKFQPHKSLTLTPGLRLDFWHSDAGLEFMWDPRLVARWEVGGGVTLKGGVGKFSQPPDMSFTDEQWGNPNLDHQWAMHYSLGVEWEFLSDYSIDLVGFYVDRHDLIAPTETVSPDGEQRFFDNIGWGRSYGMEVMLKKRPTDRWYGWVSYTLSRNETAGQVGNFGGEATAPELSISPNDQTHILSLVASVKLGRGWETGLRLRYVSGYPHTPITGSKYYGDDNFFQPLYGDLNSSRLDAFFQLDVRVEKVWTYDAWKLSLYVDLMNLTNRANTEFAVWDYRYRQSGPVSGMPFFLSLGLAGRF